MGSGEVMVKTFMPVIGILAHPKKYDESMELTDLYIHTHYAIWLWAAGAKVVPIKTRQSDEYYEEITAKINGVLLPGGGGNVLHSPYTDAAEKIYRLAIKYNNSGDYFPIWGTCLGFEVLISLAVGRDSQNGPNGRRYDDIKLNSTGETLFGRCDARDYMSPLIFMKGYEKGRLFRSFDASMFTALSGKAMTFNGNNHYTPLEAFKTVEKLKDFFNVLTISKDRNGIEYVSTIEAEHYPFYGSQWHVEKNICGAGESHEEVITSESVRIGQSFGNFFVDEARRSRHRFSNERQLHESLIENCPLFTSEMLYVHFCHLVQNE